ncbi:protein-L-isoaspartate(D-aspartate) O-methyltransferase [Muriicola sp.]|uniref:protein-L-isoaspartate(D-aspartate) O-methyltransferase n=1 Tax=Muriicola sp. TaxID=2020856 RepID=UPI003C74B335
MKRGIIRLKFVLLVLVSVCHSYAQENYAAQRQRMLKEQLEPRGITDKATLKAMGSIPREYFVPEAQKPFAYQDSPLPIGEGQTISQPFMVAYMTQKLELSSSDRVLEIGTGSGYQAAILSQMVDSVFTIEIVNSLAQVAIQRMVNLNIPNVAVRIGDGYYGWKEKAPFNAIIVTAGAERIPLYLVEQLAENGRMVIPVGPNNGVRQLVLLKKKKGKIKTRNLMPVRFVPFVRQKQ